MYTFQKSFRLEDNQLVTLKSGRPIDTLEAGEELNPAGFVATTSANYWMSILNSDALCSFATEPGVRGVIESDAILARKGIAVRVPAYTIVALASDYVMDNDILRAIFPTLPIFDSPDDLRKSFRITTRRDARAALKAK